MWEPCENPGRGLGREKVSVGDRWKVNANLPPGTKDIAFSFSVNMSRNLLEREWVSRHDGFTWCEPNHDQRESCRGYGVKDSILVCEPFKLVQAQKGMERVNKASHGPCISAGEPQRLPPKSHGRGIGPFSRTLILDGRDWTLTLRRVLSCLRLLRGTAETASMIVQYRQESPWQPVDSGWRLAFSQQRERVSASRWYFSKENVAYDKYVQQQVRTSWR